MKVIIALVCISLFFAQTLTAQELSTLTPEQRAQLETNLTKAQTAYESGDFETAKVALEEVYSQLPDADVLYRLALCYERLGQDQAAIDAYGKYLKDRPLDPERPRIEGVIRALKERSRNTTATLNLQLRPADMRVYVDGAERLESASASGERVLQLKEGKHVLRFSRDGYETDERTVTFTPDEKYNVLVSLSPIPESDSQSALGWAFLGGGAASILVGGVLVGAAFGMDDVLDASYASRTSSSRPENFDDLESRHNTYVIAGWSAVGAGVALTAVGAYFLLAGEDEQVTVAPALSDTTVGGSVRLRF